MKDVLILLNVQSEPEVKSEEVEKIFETYEKTIGHLFKTISAYAKEKKRPQFMSKLIARKTKSYTGIAGPSTKEKHESEPLVQKDREKYLLLGAGFRNLAA